MLNCKKLAEKRMKNAMTKCYDSDEIRLYIREKKCHIEW